MRRDDQAKALANKDKNLVIFKVLMLGVPEGHRLWTNKFSPLCLH